MWQNRQRHPSFFQHNNMIGTGPGLYGPRLRDVCFLITKKVKLMDLVLSQSQRFCRVFEEDVVLTLEEEQLKISPYGYITYLEVWFVSSPPTCSSFYFFIFFLCIQYTHQNGDREGFSFIYICFWFLLYCQDLVLKH